MRARINHTGRERIFRRDIDIAVDRRTDSQLYCRLERRLESYGMPDDSPVVVECYQGLQYVRILSGTVGKHPDSRVMDLSQFAGAPKVLFRLKVLDADGSGRLLGMADQIPLTRPDISDDVGTSMVRVRPADIGQQTWNIEYDELGPVLQINDSIEDWRGFVNGSPMFLPVVLPAIMDKILTKILFEDKHQPNSENDYWADQFVELAASSGNRPFTSSERNDEEVKRDWIDDVVGGFARRHGLANRLIRSLSNES